MAVPARRGPILEGWHLALIGALLGLAALGWIVTDQRMQGMDAGPGTDPGSLGFYVGAWVVMMAAMMFPSLAPMVRTYALVLRRRRSGAASATGAIAAFLAGYLLTWTAFGLVAYAAFAAIRGLDVDALSWDRGGPYVAGAVILAAAVYQLTPAKNACLSRCRSPLDFLLERWREGVGGGLRLGIEHGAWCVGCCWALMVALFAVGVMSVGWMVFVAALIAIEKLVPWRRVANLGLAVLLVALALGVALVPERVPGLTLPDEATDHGAGTTASDRG